MAQASQSSSPSGGTSSAQQAYQSRLNAMDSAFADASATLATCLTQLTSFKQSISNGTPVNWTQIEAVYSNIVKAQSQMSTARQSVPITVPA